MTRYILDRIFHAAAPLVAVIGMLGAWYVISGYDIVMHPLREFMRYGDPTREAYLMYQHAAQLAVQWGWSVAAAALVVVAVIFVLRGHGVVPEQGGDGGTGRNWR